MFEDDNALSKLVVASRTDVGRCRSENQDACGELTSSMGERLLVVADGMGGHQGGAEASRRCVANMERVFLELEDPPDDRLLRGLAEANADVYQAAQSDPDLEGMGATAVAFLLGPDGTGWVAWVGDSRLYRLREGELKALTEDHSLVQQWVRLGVLSADEAADHPKRNELTRAIGVMPDVEADLVPVDLRPDDRYLLCSDGLCGVIDDASIAEALGGAEPEHAARDLIDRANAGGGPDNVTVQIAWLREDDEPDEAGADGPVDAEPEPPLELATESPAGPGPGPAPLASAEMPSAPAPEPTRAFATPVRDRSAPAGSAADRDRDGSRLRELHPPSLLAGILAGIALAAVGDLYLRWQGPADAPPPAPAPRVPPATPPAPAPEPAATPPAPAPPATRATPPAPAAEVPRPEPAPRPAAPEPAPAEIPPPPAPEPPAVPAAPPAAPEPAPAAEPARVLPPSPAEADGPAQPPGSDVIVVGEVPDAQDVRWIPVPEPEPTADAFDLPDELRTFLDGWLRALTRNDHSAHAALGFGTPPEEFARTQAGRESYRLHEVEISDRSDPRQLYVRVVVSWAFYAPGGRRFRQEEERRYILDRTPAGLRYSGLWSE